MNDAIFHIPLRRIYGEEATLNDYRGKVVPAVNVASACGLAPDAPALLAAIERELAA